MPPLYTGTASYKLNDRMKLRNSVAAAAAYRSHAYSEGIASQTGQVVNKPAGVAVGDILFIIGAENGSIGVTAFASTGFTVILQYDDGNAMRFGVMYKVADAADVAASSFTVNTPYAATAGALLMCIAYSGGTYERIGSVADKPTFASGANNYMAVSGFTATTAGLLIGVVIVDDGASAIADINQGSMTRDIFINFGSGSAGSIGVFSQTIASGATGTRVFTTTNGSGYPTNGFLMKI